MTGINYSNLEMHWVGMTQVITSQQWKLWNYQFSQKCEIYTEMQWMFGIQAILDTIDAKY